MQDYPGDVTTEGFEEVQEGGCRCCAATTSGRDDAAYDDEFKP